MKTRKLNITALALVLLVSMFGLSLRAQEKSKIQIAILLDTSSSMDGLIDQAKSQLWKIVNQMATATYKGKTPELEIALYEYGNDNLPAAEGFIRKVSELTTDLDQISEDLFSLKTYGGEEYCGEVIEKSFKQLLWSASNEDLKMIVIAGNEPFTQGKLSYEAACKNAIANGIVVNTIFCGNYEEGIKGKWKAGAKLTNGKYMNIDQNQTVAYIESPYDDEILKLNRQLNDTYIGYGSRGRSLKTRQSVQDSNAGSMNKGVAVSRSITKSSKKYKNSTWDLVDAADDSEEILESISSEQLPDEMKGMDTEERKKYIKGKKNDREKIQREMKVLKAKRDKFVAEQQKESANENTLDAVMLKTVREQATKKNYKFN